MSNSFVRSWRQLPAANRAATKGGVLVIGSSFTAGLTDQAFNLRDSLPQPFDYPQHAANVTAGMGIGALVGTAATVLYDRFGSQEEHSQRRIRALAVAAATIAGTVVNAAFETRTGIRLLHMEAFAGTPDPLDFVYGVASSALSGEVTPAFRNEQPPAPQSTEQ
jgi:hypothetical protein